jgi:hypothetical protein
MQGNGCTQVNISNKEQELSVEQHAQLFSALHSKTRAWIIYNFLFLQKGQSFSQNPC